MRHHSGVIAAAVILAATLAVSVHADEPLARQGVGLLPPPPANVAPLANNTARPFLPDPSGGFSRVVFEADAAPDLRVVIREYSVPAGTVPRTLTLNAAAMLHVLHGTGNVVVGTRPLAFTTTPRIAAAAGTTVHVTSTGAHPLVLRVVSLEPK